MSYVPVIKSKPNGDRQMTEQFLSRREQMLRELAHEQMTLYLDTHTGPVAVTLTGKEATTPSGTRAVEVAGWLRDPTFVDADRLSTSADFSSRTIQRMRSRDAA